MNIYFYFISNAFFLILLFGLLVLNLFLESWKAKKMSIKHITLISMLVCISVILTNIIGYSFSFFSLNITLELGQWILFVIGIFFGPIQSFVASICVEILGCLINIGGLFHFGFTFSTCLISFFGSLVYLSKNQKYIKIKIIIYFLIFYLIKALLINPISFYAIGWDQSIYINIIFSLIKTPILIVLYLSLIIPSYKVIYALLDRYFCSDIWAFRFQDLPNIPINF